MKNQSPDYEGSEPKNEPVSQKEKEENSDAEYETLRYLEQGHQEQGPDVMASWLQDLFIQLGFSPEAAKLFIREQELDSLVRLRVLTDKNVDDICTVMRKPGCKNANGTPDRGQQVSVIAQENLKLAALLFHNAPLIGKLWECMKTQCAS